MDVNNLYGWAMLHKLPVNEFEWIEETSQLNDDFIKNYNEDSDKEYFLEVDAQYLQKLHELHSGLPFLPERKKIRKLRCAVTNLYDKNDYVIY